MQLPLDKQMLYVRGAIQRYDGYRQHSAMERKVLQFMDKLNYSEYGSLKVMLLASLLEYQTPGGLTEEQVIADRRLARQPTASCQFARRGRTEGRSEE
jgi:iron complex outermembrane receptor protein